MLADRITVLRDGEHVVTDDAASSTARGSCRRWSGATCRRALRLAQDARVRPAGREGADRAEPARWRRWCRNNSFSVFAGQITGVFGLVGSGRTETVKVVAGVLKRDFFHGGEVRPARQAGALPRAAPAVRAGIVYVTEDRKVEGFFETMSIAENIYLGLLAKFPAAGRCCRGARATTVGKQLDRAAEAFARSATTCKVVELSGGNQQKVVIAKSLVQKPKLIIFDEPTRGVDVGAIAEIHELINRLADEGMAVMVISSYLPEIMALSDRILVSRQGKVVEEFSALEATRRRSCTRRCTELPESPHPPSR